MHKYTAPGWARTIYEVSANLTEDFGGGSFQTRVTCGGAVMTYLVLIAWYWLMPACSSTRGCR